MSIGGIKLDIFPTLRDITFIAAGGGNTKTVGGITKLHHPFWGGDHKNKGNKYGGITKSYFRISQNLTFSKYDLQNFRGYAAYHTVFQYNVTCIGKVGKSQSTRMCSICM